MQTGNKVSPVSFGDDGTLVPCLGGFPHKRHRAYRLKVALQRWRVRAVQEESD